MTTLTKKTLGFALTAISLAVSTAAFADEPVTPDTSTDKDYVEVSGSMSNQGYGYTDSANIHTIKVTNGANVQGSTTGISLTGKVGDLSIESGAMVSGVWAGVSLGGGFTGTANITGASLTATTDANKDNAAALMIRGQSASGSTVNIADSTLTGYNGIYVRDVDAGTFNITGTTKIDATNFGFYFGSGKMGALNIGESASITGGTIGVNIAGSMESLTVNGTVTATTQTGVNLLDSSSVTDKIYISGDVTGQWAGLYVGGSVGSGAAASDDETAKPNTVPSLVIDNGAKITSNSTYGIRLGSGSHIYGGIDVTNAQISGATGGMLLEGTVSGGATGLNIGTGSLVSSITVNGTVEGSNTGIQITGTVGDTDNTAEALVLGSGATVTGTSGYAIQNDGQINGKVVLAGTISGGSGAFINNGTITNGIEFKNNTDIVIDNTGTIAGDITATGSGSVTIKNWYLPTDESQLVVKGSSASKVSLDNVVYGDIIGTADAAKTQKGIDMKTRLINGGDTAAGDEGEAGVQSRTGSNLTTTLADLSEDVQRLGFKSTWDVDNQVLDVKLSQDATAGGVLGQAVAQQSVRRDYFIDTLVDDAVQSAQYHAKANMGQGSVFVKPYASSDSYDLGGSNFDGNTYGLLLGANYVANDFGVTGFVGYESSQFDANYTNGDLGVDADTYYFGATGFANIAKLANQDVFVKVGTKAALTRNDLSRSISGVESSAKTNALSWSVKAQAGVNWNVTEKTLITPTVGVGYMSANLDDFALSASAEQDSYNLNTVAMPYAELGLNWTQSWTDSLRTNFGGGYRYMFDKTQDITSTFTKLEGSSTNGAPTSISGQYDLSNSYEFVTANATWSVTKTQEVSFGYTGVFGNNGQSHNVTAKYEYLF